MPLDDKVQAALDTIFTADSELYANRGWNVRSGFGKRPALLNIDLANAWTRPGYKFSCDDMDESIIPGVQRLLKAAGAIGIPIIYTTSPYRPGSGDQPFKSAADPSVEYRAWDARACEIDERIAPQQEDYVIEKESASAFSGTHLSGYLVEHAVDTLLIAGCSTSACIRATATDAKSLRFRPVIVDECVGDRSAVAHVFTLFDIQARFSDVCGLAETMEYIEGL